MIFLAAINLINLIGNSTLGTRCILLLLSLLLFLLNIHLSNLNIFIWENLLDCDATKIYK